MQILNVGATGTAQGALNQTAVALQKILQRLSTGQRINSASDDAAGLSISEQLNTQINGFKMASQNVNDAMDALNIADGASGQISDILQRQRDLAVQASNDTLNPAQRNDINTEYQQLNQAITQIAQGSQYNTQGVAAGTGLASGNAQAQVGPNAGDQMTMPQVNVTAAALGVTGTSVTTRQAAQSALTTIDNAINTLNTQRSTVGATVNSLQSIQNNISVASVNTQAAESVLTDQDMAEGVTTLTTQQLLQETGLQAFARFQEVSANHLLGLLK